MWYDAQDAVNGLVLSGSNVTSWKDKSGNNYTATATGSPVVSSASGFNWVGGFSASNFLDAGDVLPITDTTGFSIFVVMEHPGSTAGGSFDFVVGAATTATNKLGICIEGRLNNGQPGIELNVYSVTSVTRLASPNPANNTPYLLDATLDAGSGSQTLRCKVSSGTESTVFWSNTNLSTGLAHMMIGYNSVFTNSTLGKIAEILIYPAGLSSGDRTAVRNYLNAKYSLSP